MRLLGLRLASRRLGTTDVGAVTISADQLSRRIQDPSPWSMLTALRFYASELIERTLAAFGYLGAVGGILEGSVIPADRRAPDPQHDGALRLRQRHGVAPNVRPQLIAGGDASAAVARIVGALETTAGTDLRSPDAAGDHDPGLAFCANPTGSGRANGSISAGTGPPEHPHVSARGDACIGPVGHESDVLNVY